MSKIKIFAASAVLLLAAIHLNSARADNYYWQGWQNLPSCGPCVPQMVPLCATPRIPAFCVTPCMPQFNISPCVPQFCVPLPCPRFCIAPPIPTFCFSPPIQETRVSPLSPWCPSCVR